MTATDGDQLDATYRRYRRHLDPAGKWSSSNAGNRAMAEERRQAFGRLLANRPRPRPGLSVLEVGSGHADPLHQVLSLLDDGCRGVAVDLLAWRLPEPGGSLVVAVGAAGEALPFPASCFELVVLSTVVSSIPDRDVARLVGREVARVLRPGGAVLWYDLAVPSPGNRSVRAVPRRELRRILPGFTIVARRVTVLPPLARRLGRFTDVAYPLLARAPGLRTHRVAVLVPRGADGR